MSYPTTIPNSFEGYDLTSCNRGDNWIRTASATYLFARQGGFATIGSQPPVQFASGDMNMHAFKSTDDGLTWADMGSVDTDPSTAPHVGGSFTGVGPICRDGDTVYFVGMVNSGSSTVTGLLVFQYDLLADIWDSGTPFNPPLPVWGTSFPGVLAKMVTYGPGSMAMVFNGAVENISGTDYDRMYFVTFNGTGWGSPAVLPDEMGNQRDYIFADCLIDSNGKTHVIYGMTDPGGTGLTYRCHRTLDTGVWSAEQQVDQAFFAPLPDQSSNLVQFGTNLGFCSIFNDGSPNGELKFYYGADVDSPSWIPISLGVISSSLSVPFGNFTGVVGRAFTLTAHTASNALCLFQISSQNSPTPAAGQILQSSVAMSSPIAWTTPALLINTPAVTQAGATNPAADYGAHLAASFDDPAGVFVIGEWECRPSVDSGAENMRFTLFVPPTYPSGGGFGNVAGAVSSTQMAANIAI